MATSRRKRGFVFDCVKEDVPYAISAVVVFAGTTGSFGMSYRLVTSSTFFPGSKDIVSNSCGHRWIALVWR